MKCGDYLKHAVITLFHGYNICLNDVLGGCVRRQITVLAEMWKSRVKSLLFDSTKQRARPTFHKKF